MRPANTIQVGLKDHSMMLVDCEGHQLKELSEYFSFFVPGIDICLHSNAKSGTVKFVYLIK